MSAVAKKKTRGIPQGLARVRKELPPPGKIFKSKKKDNRKQSKAKFVQELQEPFLRKPS